MWTATPEWNSRLKCKASAPPPAHHSAPLPPENATGNFVKVVQRVPVKIVFKSIPEGAVFRVGVNVEARVKVGG